MQTETAEFQNIKKRLRVLKSVRNSNKEKQSEVKNEEFYNKFNNWKSVKDQ